MNGPDPLYNEDAERSALGSMLIDPAACDELATALAPSDFYLASNKFVFEAIVDAARNGGADVVTVTESLERMDKLDEVGGAERIAALIAAVPSSLRATSYARIVRGYAVRRTLALSASAVAKLAYDLEIPLDEVQAGAEKAVMDARREDGQRSTSARGIASSIYDQIDEWMRSPLIGNQVRGMATDVGAIDRCLGGLESGLYIVAGRPSMGKTALMLQMVEGLCCAGKRVAAFSVEMSANQIGMRLATSFASVELEALKHGKTTLRENEQVMQALAAISEWSLTVVDQSTLRPGDVLAHARRARMQHGGLDAVFVDGLWLMTPTRRHENRTQTVGSISREIKRVQRELDVPVVMAHQLSRACEQRGDKRPILSDLRETGDVEQDADVVIMLYRDDYYNEETETPNILEAWIRKNRLGGRAGIVARMFWRGKFMRCLDIERRDVDLP